MNTIISIQQPNYTERVIVNSANAEQVRNEIAGKKWKIEIQGDFLFLETERAADYVALDQKIFTLGEKLDFKIELDEDESFRGVRNFKVMLEKEQSKIYLRKKDKVAINDFYLCEAV